MNDVFSLPSDQFQFALSPRYDALFFYSELFSLWTISRTVFFFSLPFVDGGLDRGRFL